MVTHTPLYCKLTGNLVLSSGDQSFTDGDQKFKKTNKVNLLDKEESIVNDVSGKKNNLFKI